MKKNNWYKIQSKDDSAEISIFGDIGESFFGDGITAESFKADFDKVKNSKKINVSINSPGGSVFDGMSIFNIMAKYRDKISVEIMGIAASAASVIALSGAELIMHTGTFLMIHNPSGIAMGTADDMRQMAGNLDKVTEEFVNIYEAHSDLSADEIRGYMDEEKWFTGEEAVAAGFADESLDDEIAASVSLDPNQYSYKHIPAAIAASAGDREPPDNIRDFEGFLRESGYSRKKATDIAAHGFGTDQGEPEPEEAQGEPAATADETERPANAELENLRANRKLNNRGVAK